MRQSITAGLLGAAALLGATVASPGEAATFYSSRALFEAATGQKITDDYSAPGYGAGDVGNSTNFDIHSNASMSAVFGQTRYESTGFPDLNVVESVTRPDAFYCAGCNGSFRLHFDQTAISVVGGVYGVGFDIQTGAGMNAYIVFASGLTSDVVIPNESPFLPDGFFGVTSSDPIVSIHISRPGNQASTSQGFYLAIDDLTIANPPGPVTPVPEPGTLALLGLGLAALAGPGVMRRRRKG